MINPVEHYKDILIKRNDLETLYDVNGGKLKQTLALIEKNLDIIRNGYGNTITGAYGVESTFPEVISAVAKKYNINFNLLIYETKKRYPGLLLAQEYGADIYGFTVAYPNVLESYIPKYFPDTFNFNKEFYCDLTIDCVIDDVENIPDVDVLVVPMGSGINFIGILRGLKKYKKKIPKVIGFMIGNDRTSRVSNHISGIKYELIKCKRPYHSKDDVDNNFFDPLYEAKAYNWIQDNIIIDHKKILLWVVSKRYMKEIDRDLIFKHVGRTKQITLDNDSIW